MPGKSARIGDIFEIKTPAGLAYLQYTHDGGSGGALVRVLPGLFHSRPADFAELARQKELYFVFYTLKYALRDNQTEIVSHQHVPAWAQPYPEMRWPGARDQNGKVIAWKIIKASDPLSLETHRRTPLVNSLTAEQEKLSIHHIWPHPIMVKELARGWTPRRAEDLRLQDVAAATGREKDRTSDGKSAVKPMRHYLYFPKEADARKAGEVLQTRGFSVEVRLGADRENWLALATKTPPKNEASMDGLRDDMETLAAELGGEYDGWELATGSLGLPGGEHITKIN